VEKWNNAKHVSRALNCRVFDKADFVRRSSFVVRRLSFVVRRSSFVVEAALVGWEAMRWIHVS